MEVPVTIVTRSCFHLHHYFSPEGQNLCSFVAYHLKQSGIAVMGFFTVNTATSTSLSEGLIEKTEFCVMARPIIPLGYFLRGAFDFAFWFSLLSSKDVCPFFFGRSLHNQV